MTEQEEEVTGGEGEASPAEGVEEGKKKKDPARLVTIIVLVLAVVFFGLYIRADRVMPYSDQARVSGFTVAVAPQVGGYVTNIAVDLHEVVQAGQLLVEIDTLQYQIAVRAARAQLDNAIQQIDGASASVEAAAAAVAAARAQENIAQRDFDRITSIRERDPTAISQADRDRAEAGYLGAVASREARDADLRRAQATLGPRGIDNPSIRAAMAALEQAEFNLARTTVTAPTSGAIESLAIDVGHFAGPGQPLMTLVSTASTWITADMRENNLENLAPGVPVQIIFDVAPGRIFNGEVHSVGFGVGGSMPQNRGTLPSVSTQTGWLRQPQQFPVRIDVVDEVPEEMLRIGAQVSVMAFTGRHPILNPIGRLVMRINAILTYLR
jgi:multidrug resistance efflux pump